jgi:hypothetical protein
MLWRVAPPIVISPAADTRMLDSSAIRVKLTSAVGHLPTPRGTPPTIGFAPRRRLPNSIRVW